MKPDTTSHRRHASDVELTTVDISHPVLEDHQIRECPHSECDYFEFVDDPDSIAMDHDIEWDGDLDERLDELKASVSLPVYMVEHVSGMKKSKYAFPTEEQARAWVYGNYGPGDSTPRGGQIRRTYSRANGSHSQRAAPRDYPCVFAIVNTALEPSDYGYLVATNLVPRDEDFTPDRWRQTPSVESVVEKHLSPSGVTLENEYRPISDPTPEWYDGGPLQWHVEQVTHWEVRIQTPELLLDDDEVAQAADLTDDWSPSQQQV